VLNVYVIVFLRHLEYFKGIMILTTNRADTMDPAFDSRVDIRLHYPDLDAAARREVWVNFVAKSKGLSIERADLDNLAELDLNGREIKSVMKMAHLLASGRDETIGFGHIRTVLKITRGKTLDQAPREQ
jgi:SpoVK/Ycf46/Vps4 family AAA+-type ATPase